MTKGIIQILAALFLSLLVQGGVFRVGSYNIRHGCGMDQKIDLNRIAATLAKMDADVITLQEVDKNCQRSGNIDLAAQLAKKLKMDYRFAASFAYDGGQYGLAVLSRLPIKEMKQHRLPGGSEPRTALEVKVRLQSINCPVSVVSIHNDWVSDEVRCRQINSLLDQISGRAHPVILAGDFNAEPHEDSMGILVQKGWVILDKKGAKTCPADLPTLAIDHLVTKDLSWELLGCRVLEEKIASDHRPIVAEWKIPAGGS